MRALAITLMAVVLGIACPSCADSPCRGTSAELRDAATVVLELPEVRRWASDCAARGVRLVAMEEDSDASGSIIGVFEDHDTHVSRRGTFRVDSRDGVEVLDTVSDDWLGLTTWRGQRDR